MNDNTSGCACTETSLRIDESPLKLSAISCCTSINTESKENTNETDEGYLMDPAPIVQLAVTSRICGVVPGVPRVRTMRICRYRAKGDWMAPPPEIN